MLYLSCVRPENNGQSSIFSNSQTSFSFPLPEEGMSPDRLSRSYPYCCSQNCFYQTWGFFHIVTAHAGGLAAMKTAGYLCHTSVCPVSPKMVLIFRQCWPDLHPCVVVQDKQVRDDPQLSSSISPHREPWAQASAGKRDKGNRTQPKLVGANLEISSNITLMITFDCCFTFYLAAERVDGYRQGGIGRRPCKLFQYEARSTFHQLQRHLDLWYFVRSLLSSSCTTVSSDSMCRENSWRTGETGVECWSVSAFYFFFFRLSHPFF